MTTARNVRLLIWFSFFANLKFYLPIQIIYFAEVTGSFAAASFIMALVQVAAAVAEIPTGVLSDMIGRKRTLVLGTVLAVASVTCYAVALNQVVLVVGALFEGVYRALYSGNNDALLHDTLAAGDQPETYARHYSRIGTVVTLALFCSSLMSSVFASISYALLMALSVVAQLVGFVLSARVVDIPPKHPTPTNPYRHVLDALQGFRANPRLALMSASTILGNGIGLTAYQFQPAVYGLLWPLWAIGLARALAELLAVLSFHFSERIIRVVGNVRIILLDSIFSWLANVVGLLFASGVTPALIATSPALYGPATTAIESLKQAEFSDAQRATMASLNAFGSGVVYAVLMLPMGAVADAFGPIRSLLLVQLCYTSVIVINGVLLKNWSDAPA